MDECIVQTELSNEMIVQIMEIQRTGVVPMNIGLTNLIITLDYLDDAKTLNIIFDCINNDNLLVTKICWDQLLRIPTLPLLLCGKNPNDKDICPQTSASAVEHNHLNCVKVLSRTSYKHTWTWSICWKAAKNGLSYQCQLERNMTKIAARCGYLEILKFLCDEKKYPLYSNLVKYEV